MGKRVTLAKAAPRRALAGLNRLTGLNFSRWPESLVNPGREDCRLENGETKESSGAQCLEARSAVS
jgi:hypothetical protein